MAIPSGLNRIGACLECELCSLALSGGVTSKLYYEDSVCIIVDCANCNLPMVVLRHHDPSPSSGELNHILAVALDYFVDYAHFRGYVNSCRGHYHEHIVSGKFQPKRESIVW